MAKVKAVLSFSGCIAVVILRMIHGLPPTIGFYSAHAMQYYDRGAVSKQTAPRQSTTLASLCQGGIGEVDMLGQQEGKKKDVLGRRFALLVEELSLSSQTTKKRTKSETPRRELSHDPENPRGGFCKQSSMGRLKLPPVLCLTHAPA
jgi:hypothetical protein